MVKTDIFEKKSISQLIIIFSLPTICSLVLESVSSMVDTAFAGHLGTMSKDALSAMGLLSPILLILIAAQLIFGVSTSIVISKRLGENNQEKVNNTFKVGFYASVISSSLISIIIFFMQDGLLNILGATGNVRILAKEYLNVAVIFNVFSAVGYMLVNNIRAFGYPKIEIIVGVTSTIVNIVFNFLFTFVFDMGIKGIALSTLISEVYYFAFAFIYLSKKGLWFRNSSLDFDEAKEIFVSLFKIGFVQFLMQSLNSVSGFIINKVLIKYAGLTYIGSMAICSNINMVVLLPLIGLTQGIQSVLAYYHGSNNEEREKIVKSKTIKYSLIYSIVSTVLVFLFTSNILKIFTTDVELVSISVPIVRIMLSSFPFVGVIYAMITFMQVSGKEDIASKLELIRQIGLLIPLVVIFPMIFSRYNIMNISPEVSVFLAMPITNMILIVLYWISYKKSEL
ncbi:MAG: MATE family efflux transporter [Peptostreptococcaceae bacterium]